MTRYAAVVVAFLLAVGQATGGQAETDAVVRAIKKYEERFSYSHVSFRMTTSVKEDDGPKLPPVHGTLTSHIRGNWHRAHYRLMDRKLDDSIRVTDGRCMLLLSQGKWLGEGTAMWMVSPGLERGFTGSRELTPFRCQRGNNEPLEILSVQGDRTTIRFHTGKSNGRRFVWEYRRDGDALMPVKCLFFTAPTAGNYELYDTTVYHYSDTPATGKTLARIERTSAPGIGEVWKVLKLDLNPSFGYKAFRPVLGPWTKVKDMVTMKPIPGGRKAILEWLNSAGAKPEIEATQPALRKAQQ